MTEIGMELYNWRCNNNLSQREAAHSLGVSQAQICAYEKGKHMPSMAVLARIMEKIRPAAEEQPVQEDKPEEVLPFPIRLARSRGISDEYMQRTLDMVRNRDRDEDAPQDAQGGGKTRPSARLRCWNGQTPRRTHARPAGGHFCGLWHRPEQAYQYA